MTDIEAAVGGYVTTRPKGGTGMSRNVIGSFVAAGLMALVIGGGAAGAFAANQPSPLAGEWNRLSLDRSHPAPEHELFRCVENNGVQSGTSSNDWFCHYWKEPERALNFYWDDTHGFFSGNDVTATWSCPAWFPTTVCMNVVQVVEGTTVYTRPGVPGNFPVREDYVVTQTGGSETMNAYWIDYGFECPWFRTFDEAVATNPLPLPFNGTWASQDCVVAP